MSERRIFLPSIDETTSIPSKSIASYFFSYVLINISCCCVRTDPEDKLRLEFAIACAISPIVNLYLIKSSGEISIENSLLGSIVEFDAITKKIESIIKLKNATLLGVKSEHLAEVIVNATEEN